MAYGIVIKNANGNVQIDSDTVARGFIVTDSGTGTSPGKIDADQEFIFAKPAYSSGNYHLGVELGAADSNGKQTMTFKNGTGLTNLNCDWIKAVVSDTLTASTSGYGIQVFNEDGDLAFDSGKYTGDGGVGVTDFAESFSLTGDYDRLDTDTSKYALVNNTLQTATFSNVYYYAYSPTLSTNVATAGIYFYGNITLNLGFIYGGGSYLQSFNITNLGSMILADGGSV